MKHEIGLCIDAKHALTGTKLAHDQEPAAAGSGQFPVFSSQSEGLCAS
jgi:hypothetical protein